MGGEQEKQEEEGGREKERRVGEGRGRGEKRVPVLHSPSSECKYQPQGDTQSCRYHLWHFSL